jgi:hypothetical protein
MRNTRLQWGSTRLDAEFRPRRRRSV